MRIPTTDLRPLIDPICALDVPGDEDLSALTRVLWRDELPHRVVLLNTRQKLYVSDETAARRVRQLYLLGPEQARPGAPRRPSRTAIVWQTLRASPVTALIIAAALLLAPAGMFEQRWAETMLSWLAFTKPMLTGAVPQISPLAQVFAQHQWWRLLTPSLLHFSLLHLMTNVVLFWEFGRRIEARLGGVFMALLFVWGSVVANIAQYLLSPAAIFGGLSGVVIAELGFTFTVGRTRAYATLLPNPVFAAVMLLSLLVMSSGITDVFGLHIANGAHWAGLAAGVALGLGVLAVQASRP